MNSTVWPVTVLVMLLTGVLAAEAGERATEAQPWSPQTFCSDHGGIVTQTGDPQVHICCYAQKRRCVSVDERSRSTELLSGVQPGNAQVRR